ncbi:MAG: alpha/beta fold hydrolase BchO [Paracoccaceae bacterium]
MARGLRWEREARTWPHAETSRFVRAGGIEWHVQVMGPDGAPEALLLHGAGAAGMSWRRLAPRLAGRFRAIVPDLPGHGFTGRPFAAPTSLPLVAERLGALLSVLGARPALVVGHSAGAAVLARMALDGRIAPEAFVAVNGALTPFRGVAALALPGMARLLSFNPLAPAAIATAAIDPNAVPLLLRSTGSRIDREGEALYGRLFRNMGHVAGVVAMMAAWDLSALARDLPRLRPAPLLLAGSLDRAVPPAEAEEVAARIPGARALILPGLGHLAHEEDAARVLEAILGAP